MYVGSAMNKQMQIRFAKHLFTRKGGSWLVSN